MLSSEPHHTRLYSCGRQEGLGQTVVIGMEEMSAMVPPWFYRHTIPREPQWVPKHDRQLNDVFFLLRTLKFKTISIKLLAV